MQISDGLSILHSPSIAILWLLVGVAAAWDISTRRIPNALIVIGLLLGAAAQTQISGLWGLGTSLLGAAAGLGLLIGPFAMRVMGGGDVKLTMVCGAFLGVNLMLEVTVLASALHGALALAVVLSRVLLARLGRPTGEAPGLPYAASVAAGVVLVTSGTLRLFGG
jgi:Flp pilus assembly protein protease CpaA